MAIFEKSTYKPKILKNNFKLLTRINKKYYPKNPGFRANLLSKFTFFK